MTPLSRTQAEAADRHWAVVSSATRPAADHRRAANWVGLWLIRAGSALVSVGPGPAGRPGPATPLPCEA